MNLKEILIYSSAIFTIIIVVILLSFSVFNLYKTLAPSWCFGNLSMDMPYASAMCQKFKNNFEITTTINNSNKEIKNITCQLVSNGGMTADKEKIEIPFISPNSSDICTFVLTGEPTKTATVRITYSKKGFWGYKNFSTISSPYPDCSTTANPDLNPKPY